MANVVKRTGFAGQKSAADLVLALGTGLKPRKPVLNAVLYALVVAGLEMDVAGSNQAAPAAPVQAVVVAPENRAGQSRVVPGGDANQTLCPEPVRRQHQERPVERRSGAVQAEGCVVARVHQVTLRAGQLRAGAKAERPALFAGRGALGTNVLARLAAQVGQEFIKAGVAGVVPVILPVKAFQPAGPAQKFGVGIGAEIDCEIGRAHV